MPDRLFYTRRKGLAELGSSTGLFLFLTGYY